MEHFYQNIQGYNNNSIFYKQTISELQDGAHIVEVGCLKGRSSSFVAVEIINSGKNIKFDCVDSWLVDNTEPMKIDSVDTRRSTPYEQFIKNMKPVENYYTPVHMSSVEAAALYTDKSLDLVFLDADHTYQSVRNDILAWLPKVKLGGILAGDDYNQRMFPGLVRATNELLKPLQINYVTWIYKNE